MDRLTFGIRLPYVDSSFFSVAIKIFFPLFQICHKRQFNSRTEILPEIFKIVDHEFFVPIGYRSSLTFDYFFVINQGKAIKKLFEESLRITVKGTVVDLVVKLCVTKFKEGQLNVSTKLDKIIQASVDPQTPSVANLSYLQSHQQLADVIFLMSNEGCFKLFCKRLNIALNIHRNIKTVKLSNNEISNLHPLNELSLSLPITLDLRYNKVHSIEEFHHLKNLKIHEIFLVGNPVTNISMFMERIKDALPTLNKIDSNHVGQTLIHPKQMLIFDNRNDLIKNSNLDCEVIRAVDVNDFVKRDFVQKVKNSSTWQKIVVQHNGKVSKNTILSETNKQFLTRIQFYPCYYKQDKKNDSFLLHENFEALSALIHKNLTMKIESPACEVKFEIHLNWAEWQAGQINWRHKINYVTRKRIKSSKLNLDSFASDSDLCNIDVPMSIATIGIILTSAHAIDPQIIKISLKDNKISATESLNYLKNFDKLVSIDLRDNRIENLDGFPVMSTVSELFFDRNPYCVRFYDEPWRYASELRNTFTNLEFIDGCRIDENLIPIVVMRNFLVSPSLYTLTENFIKFFFDLYDSVHRKCLKKLYENDSLFTLSSELNESSYEFYSRNLLKANRAEMNECNLFLGTERIIDRFEKLPRTCHDYTTMCVDVPLMTNDNKLIQIVVNGYFKDMGIALNDDEVVYGFTRTFFLQRSSKQKACIMSNTFKYCIKNEQLHIRRVNALESKKAFKKDVVTEDEIKTICKDLMPVKSQEEEANILMFKAMTTLNTMCCKRFVNFDDSPSYD